MDKFWLEKFNNEFDELDYLEYYNNLIIEVQYFTDIYLANGLLKTDIDPNEVWKTIEMLWAVTETRHFGNPWNLLSDDRSKSDVAIAIRYMLDGLTKDINLNDLLLLGPYRGFGESMRTEMLYKLFPNKYPVKNWKSECGLTIVCNELGANIDFIVGDYECFVEFSRNVYEELLSLSNLKKATKGKEKYTITDYFLGSFVYYDEDAKSEMERLRAIHKHPY